MAGSYSSPAGESGIARNGTPGRRLLSPSQPRTPAGVGRANSGLEKNSDTPGRRLLQSPSLDLLSPNDDESERAKARAARAAQRRRSLGPDVEAVGMGSSSSPPEEDANILSHDALKVMLQNCLKLANANKINQGNTWDLKLIDHMSELVRNDAEDNSQTDFQLASCTLETGVKIYSCRVDSVHSEAYKLLGGLGRSAHDQATVELPADGHGDIPNPAPAAATAGKAGSTLAASNEALNVKKFDVAFNVDPLFYQTSALFDEGGAQGLLLHNLSVYAGCEIIFDSFEVPEKSMKAQAAIVGEEPESLDLSFMKDTIERMLDALRQEPEITPTLKEIVKLVNDPHRAAFEVDGARAGPSSQAPEVVTPSRSWSGTPDFDAAQDDDPGEVFDQADDIFDGSLNGTSPGSWTSGDAPGGLEDFDEGDDGAGDVFSSQDPLEWLAMSTGMPAKSNAWAGPDHWKYAKPREESRSTQMDGEKHKSARKQREPFSIDYENDYDAASTAFQPPKNRRSLLLPQRICPPSTLLPEDFHYEAASLAKFTLRPSLMVFRRRSWKRSERGTSAECFGDIDDEAKWGEGDNEPSGGWGDGTGLSDAEDPMGVDLVVEPRKVQQIAVRFDRHAKAVDVRLLKQSLWAQLQQESAANDQENKDEEESGLSFHKMLQRFPEDCDAASPEDISVHLCFICLLHLANEHALRIDGCSTMDDLHIFSVSS